MERSVKRSFLENGIVPIVQLRAFQSLQFGFHLWIVAEITARWELFLVLIGLVHMQTFGMISWFHVTVPTRLQTSVMQTFKQVMC